MAAALLVVGNWWLMVALVLLLGQQVARNEPTMYSFMGWGGWCYPKTYGLWIGLCLAIAAVHFILSYFVWRKRA